MATQFNFDNKLIKLPGVYSRIKGGTNNTPVALSYGNVLLIDMDATSAFGGGAGVDGELDQGEDSVYGFDRLINMREFIGGGKMWDLALPLFKPFGAIDGCSNVYYIRGLATIAATATLTGTNGGFECKVRHEGLVGNGVLTSGILTEGFSITMEAGVVNPAKYKIKFHRGTWTGLAVDSQPYDGLSKLETNSIIIAQTPEVADWQEVIDWAATNEDFKGNFSYTSGTAGAIVAADLTAFAADQLFSGGTQSAANIDLVLDAIGKLDYSHVLAPQSGVDAAGADNLKLLAHLSNEAKYNKIMVVAGGDVKGDFATSLASAVTLDSQRVVLVHGGVQEPDPVGTGLRDKDAVYKAAYILGRISGLTPQTPLTYKGFGYAGERHRITDREKEEALDNGVLTTYYDDELGFFACTQGVNTLQANTASVNPDGTSHSWQSVRVIFHLLKLLEVRAKKDLFGNQTIGPNRNTVDEGVVSEWTKGFLQDNTVTETQDNLILSYENITTNRKQDAYFVNLEVEPNSEVNKLFFTAILLEG